MTPHDPATLPPIWWYTLTAALGALTGFLLTPLVLGVL